MVFEYDYKSLEKMSVDYIKSGIEIRYEKRIFDNRKNFAIDYDTECKTYVEDIL